MAEENKQQNVDSLYIGLVMSLEASAMQSMGKMMNPMTGKTEKNLQQAQMTIDMLDMIEKKTAGNLTPDEEKLTKRVLYQLRMNYLDEINAEKDKRSEHKTEESTIEKEDTKKDDESADKERPDNPQNQ
ncbi:MAG: DUF1844 domain-containing protein [candidate division Zixibacteria bacterium]|nr:DUF1844 domain-containing protein [candidate division Zixibacteria bacterium]NIR62927.1 DUF1844 domain-containing protein [candidate division Zixibacteria bacterium]NIS16064.1 DUF1844 domain-containing protein [candidate division Zixibacteria bacterium]NIS44937.1 DUF1844 domain-containing protein [candidate division Zixibacteria bacterium]NIT52475.1 DUF1844 domain-containing protein [candidate division Zixibacteria bacterium]